MVVTTTLDVAVTTVVDTGLVGCDQEVKDMDRGSTRRSAALKGTAKVSTVFTDQSRSWDYVASLFSK